MTAAHDATSHLESSDGTRLHMVYDAPAQPSAYVMMVHGFGEHCGRYEAFAQALVENGFGVLRFDYRGHGRSDGRRGHVYEFADYLRDFNAARDHVIEQNKNDAPLFVLAHSYGGLISLHALARDPGGVSGVVFSSPFFGFAIKVPAWKAAAGNMLSRYVPAFSMPTDIDPKDVSHDPEVVKAYGTDPLIGRVATSRWFTETKKAHAAFERIASPI